MGISRCRVPEEHFRTLY